MRTLLTAGVATLMAATAGAPLQSPKNEGTWGGKPPAPERYYDLADYQKAVVLIG